MRRGKLVLLCWIASSLACMGEIVRESTSEAVWATVVIRVPLTEAPELESFEGYAIEWRVVCVDALTVRGGPYEWAMITVYLERGERVRVREWDHHGGGWVMIEPARWVNGDYLCRE